MEDGRAARSGPDSALRPDGPEPDPDAARKFHDPAAAAQLAQVEPGGAIPQPEGAAEILDLGQMPALERMLEAGVEAAFPQLWGNLETQHPRRRVIVRIVHAAPVQR